MKIMKIYNHFDWFDLVLFAYILFMGVICMMIAGNKPFNFDEFQVMYASASLVRGKAYYADGIGQHFPFCNILLSFLCFTSGFKTTTIILARYFILLISGVTLIYAYRIGALLWNKKTGLFIVSLILSAVIFVNKGLEIRHDVFNALFNTMGCYYVLKHLLKKRSSYLLISGFCLGLAVASTQKGIVGALGIIIGMILFGLRRKTYKMIVRIILYYVIIIPFPLALCVLFLIVMTGDDFYSFFQYSIPNVIRAFAPHTKNVYPFLYNKWELIETLFFQNGLFFSLGIGGIISSVILWYKVGSKRIIVAVWSTFGLLFYFISKRPFFQTLLPAIPSLAVIVGGMLMDAIRLAKGWSFDKKIGLIIACVLILFAWPIKIVLPKAFVNPAIGKQLDNISFCLDNLKEDDKVFCFTQNQIFFDPALRIIDKKAGYKHIKKYSPKIFKQVMIEEQCKVIIDDYRTRVLSNETRKVMKDNYLSTRIGNILIPGFILGAQEITEKVMWIEGFYYSPTLSLKINDDKIINNVFFLKKEKYTFNNLSSRQVHLVYIFKPENFRNQGNE